MTLPRGQRSWPCWKMCTTTRGARWVHCLRARCMVHPGRGYRRSRRTTTPVARPV